MLINLSWIAQILISPFWITVIIRLNLNGTCFRFYRSIFTTDVGNETKITHQRFSVILFSLIHWETRPNKPPALNADNILPIPLNADSGLSIDPIQQTALSGAASISDGLDLWLPNGFSEFPAHCDLVNKIIVLVKEIWFREWNHCKLHFYWWTIGGKDDKLKFSFPIQLIRIITIMWI